MKFYKRFDLKSAKRGVRNLSERWNTFAIKEKLERSNKNNTGQASDLDRLAFQAMSIHAGIQLQLKAQTGSSASVAPLQIRVGGEESA